MHVENPLARALPMPAALDNQARAVCPAFGDLSSDLEPVQRAGEGLAQQCGELGHGGQHRHGIAVNEHKARVRIDRIDCIEREDVVRAFQKPLSRAGLALQMLQEAFVEAVRFDMAVCLEPALIRRDVVRGVETQALENLRRYVGAFLRRIRGKRMKLADSGRQSLKGSKLPGHPGSTLVAALWRS